VDVVYLCRDGENEELRYSLRSLANLPHERVWVFGGAPEWVRGVEFVATDQRDTKYRVTTRALRTACEHPAVSDPFYLFNDDFYVIRPVDEVPVLHRGPVAGVLRQYRERWGGVSQYSKGMAQTLNLLKRLGYPRPLSYELHVPLAVHKAAMLEALDVGAESRIRVLHKRTLYGNLAGIGGEKIGDCKISKREARTPIRGPWLSSSDGTFEGLERFLRSRFREHSPYEPPGLPPVAPAEGEPGMYVLGGRYYETYEGRRRLLYPAGAIVPEAEAARLGLLPA
jgi:hypothetical protein